ncbi:MAG TPA: DUF503 domain-containing protein [Thermoanaerobaculia bacterium]|nr:DUF503 domain-containing protein [Thermoanaerobaculia bacterium]
MVVGISSFELHLPQSRGLKDKRRVVKSLIERIHQRFRVSIAETAHHDLLQRAEISIAAVAQTEREAERMLDEIRDLIDGEPEAYLTLWQPQVLEAQA